MTDEKSDLLYCYMCGQYTVEAQVLDDLRNEIRLLRELVGRQADYAVKLQGEVDRLVGK